MSDIAKQGSFSWAELATTDVEGAKKFYTALLGWTTEPAPMEGMEYTLVKVGEERVAGIMSNQCSGGEIKPQWGVYITVDDVDATAAKAGELGGKVLMPPTDIPQVGRFAVLMDPQGVMFSVITYVPMYAGGWAGDSGRWLWG
jgi:predicted enzyme related to lactoylglutathione lyase